MKKISAFICCILCMALLSFSAFASEIKLPYTYTTNVVSGIASNDTIQANKDIFKPLTAVYQDPILWGSFGSFNTIRIDASFSCSDEPSYVIIPNYEFFFKSEASNVFESVYLWGGDEYVSDFALIDQASGYTYDFGFYTIVYSFSLYKRISYNRKSVDLRLYTNQLKDLGYDLAFPLYAPQFIFNTDPSSTWDNLNSRLDIIDSALTGIDNKLDNLNSTVSRILDEVSKQRDFLENPSPSAVSQSEHIESELSRVNGDVSGALAALSIPSVNFEPSNFVLPDDSNVTKDFLSWFSNLYPLNIILPAGVGLWAVYLIIHGVRSS